MSANFSVDRGRLLNLLSVIGAKSKETTAEPVLEISPKGILGYDKATAQCLSYIFAHPTFFSSEIVGDVKMIATPSLVQGLKQLSSGVVKFSIRVIAENMKEVCIEEMHTTGTNRDLYHEPIVIPTSEKIGFPRGISKFSDGVLEIIMQHERVCIADVDALRLQSLPDNVERAAMVWRPDSTLFITLRNDSGGVLEKTIPIEYFSGASPKEDVRIDLSPEFFKALVGTMLGKVRICVHRAPSGNMSGVAITSSSSDYDMGHTLAAMSPL